MKIKSIQDKIWNSAIDQFMPHYYSPKSLVSTPTYNMVNARYQFVCVRVSNSVWRPIHNSLKSKTK